MNAPSPVIQKLQRRLMELGYELPIYGADGLGGHETQNVILAFQKVEGLDPSGQFDAPTLAALNPAPPSEWHLSTTEVSIALALLSHFPGIPPEIRRLLMFPTLVQWIVAVVKGVPDDMTLVKNELAELASSDGGVVKLKTGIVFIEAILEQAKAVVNEADPTNAVQPPPSQIAVKK